MFNFMVTGSQVGVLGCVCRLGSLGLRAAGRAQCLAEPWVQRGGALLCAHLGPGLGARRVEKFVLFLEESYFKNFRLNFYQNESECIFCTRIKAG